MRVIKMMSYAVNNADTDSLTTLSSMAKAHKKFFKLASTKPLIHEERYNEWFPVAFMLTARKSPLTKSYMKAMKAHQCGSFTCTVGCELRPLPDDVGTVVKPPALFACSKCKRLKYYSAQCQKDDWKHHKHFCSVETMPKSENVVFDKNWTSEACRMLGSKMANTGIDLDGFERRMQTFLASANSS
ncbi:hypothetical protein M427DRAFT_282105 [Gonapodya prolifera JEL478]|uniref:MYND-type domain-containing protein n=1 Tax=Gonapodya prolifera (strain JEL478) TaxID=1344416 RepID=A0A139AYZ1_GONPJ|nr:hypothetical protein M427DRAFT_282105 [Gonapodya prolifera JEL478]|eukprot:KXS21924.1 hypothetical protein M427DRAFT_282105 [Gonapodya prolifera JEL478]